ncbi:MAG: SIMPL domain-containing protein [Alistipes sp.]|nr:SIMPL domain-containing protein [Alistipes sp.]
MNDLWKYIIIASSVVLSAVVLSSAVTQRYRSNTGTITVTGLGETEFTSDLIVIEGEIEVENYDAAEGYRSLEQSRESVINFLASKGVEREAISFTMPSSIKLSESVYESGDYVGSRFAGYKLSQRFNIESQDVDTVEAAARELPSLLARGINIEVNNPMYYFSELESVKLDLLAAAAADARERAKNIAENSDAELGDLAMSRAGVFQITAATGDEEFSAGGSFNLSSREKKARVTVRAEYKIKRKVK